MTERWKLEMAKAVKQIAQILPSLVNELERMNDRQEAESLGKKENEEQSTTQINEPDN